MRRRMMSKRFFVGISFIFLLSGMAVHAQRGGFIGVQVGTSAQKPKLREMEFNTDTSFCFGIRTGVKFGAVAVELNYFQASHNLDPIDFLTFVWEERELDYRYWGADLKFFLPLVLIHPYLTVGYGFYSADIPGVDKDTSPGFNAGGGVEVHLGKTFSLLAEGRYHHVKLDIDASELKLGDFTLMGGVNLYF